MERQSLERAQYMGILEIYGQTHEYMPYPVAHPSSCRFFIDTDLGWDSPTLGRTWFFAPRVVWFGQAIGDFLKSPTTWNGAAETVMHELTHVEQMTHYWFAPLNLPIVRHFTLEAWAGRNGRTANERFRYDLIKER